MDGFNVSRSQGFLNSGNVEFQNSIVSPNKNSDELFDKSFGETLKEAIQEVNQLHKTADKKMQDLATGKTDNIPDVMIAAEKADIALKLMVQVRSKIIDAYHEIMKMQV